MLQLAILGLGAMGSRIAHNLLQAGYPLTVFNRSTGPAAALAAAGATVAATPRAAAEGADLVLSMVRDDNASRAVWLHPDSGALHGLRPGAIAIESSTLTPGWVGELATTVRAGQAAFVEAPVLGSRPQAEARQLIALVGGDPETIAQVQPVLAVSAHVIHHLGPVGTASAMKLAVNALYGVQVAAWAEMLALLARTGMSTAQAVELLNTLPTSSPALQVAGKLMVAGTYAPLFPIDLVDKDFGYALALAEQLGAFSPILAVVRSLYAEARARGYGSDNIVGIKQLYDSAN